MEEDNKQLEIEYKAIQLALDMYDKFAYELITALKNTGSIWEQAKWCCRDVQGISYYQGKQDAFGEIAERVQKEYHLIKENMDSLFFEQPWEGKDDGHINERNRHLELMEYALRAIKYRKNEDVDRIIPENKFIGRRSSHELTRFKGRLADLLEGYGMEGFRLGVIAERNCNTPLRDSILHDAYTTAVDNAKKDIQFNPEHFAKELAETVIPDDMLDVINDGRNSHLLYHGNK